MIFVGIDIAKNKHDCYILDSSKEMLDTSFTFTNTLEGFNNFKSILNSYTDNFLDIAFPKLSTVVWSIHQKSCYALLLELPTIEDISKCHLTKLTNILYKTSKGHCGKEKAKKIKELARTSIGTSNFFIELELQQTIRLIQHQQDEINILDKIIKTMVEENHTPLLTISGISYVLASIILSEIGNVKNFSNSGKLLAFAGLEPSIHQSGKYTASMSRMVKRSSKYLHWALLQAARSVSGRVPVFKEYLAFKRSQGKHYLVAMSHVAKKLLRVIFHLLQNDEIFVSA